MRRRKKKKTETRDNQVENYVRTECEVVPRQLVEVVVDGIQSRSICKGGAPSEGCYWKVFIQFQIQLSDALELNFGSASITMASAFSHTAASAASF